MKLILHVFFFLAVSAKLFSQTTIAADKVIYLDSAWVETTGDHYKYIRVVKEYYASNKKTYTIKDFYKSKNIQMIGTSSDRDIVKQEGAFVYYYENGNKKSTATYLNTKKTGKEYNWYENGVLKSELEYSQNKKGTVGFKILNYWNPQKVQTVTDGNGKIEDKNEYLERSGTVKDGFPEGIWTGKHFTHNYTFTEQYEKGKLKSGTSIDSLNTQHSNKLVFERPVPKKGFTSFYNYISQNINIPAEIRNNVYGKIHISFIVDKEGNPVEPNILKGIEPGIDQSAVAVMMAAGKWNPGLERGIPVRTSYSLPITILKNSR
jgi:antitoxin component YwqK of YwqJK toxin-antitoxin module